MEINMLVQKGNRIRVVSTADNNNRKKSTVKTRDAVKRESFGEVEGQIKVSNLIKESRKDGSSTPSS